MNHLFVLVCIPFICDVEWMECFTWLTEDIEHISYSISLVFSAVLVILLFTFQAKSTTKAAKSGGRGKPDFAGDDHGLEL